jgi:thioredoxin 1
MRARRLQIAVAAVVLATGFLVYLWRSDRSTPPNSQPAQDSTTAVERNIYPDGAQAPIDLTNALSQAARENKRVLIDFGGNWCADCIVLDIYLHDPSNLSLLQAGYVLVHVNIGRYDENRNLAAKYGIPLEKGVPALAVLDAGGQVLYSQRNGEFEAMHTMDPASVNRFLNTWKPQS